MGTFDVAPMDALLSIGIPPERARAVVDSFDRSIDARVAGVDARVDRTEATLGARMQDMDATLHARIDATSAALAARIAETKTDLLKWTLGAPTAQTALLLGAIELF